MWPNNVLSLQTALSVPRLDIPDFGVVFNMAPLYKRKANCSLILGNMRNANLCTELVLIR